MYKEVTQNEDQQWILVIIHISQDLIIDEGDLREREREGEKGREKESKRERKREREKERGCHLNSERVFAPASRTKTLSPGMHSGNRQSCTMTSPLVE